MAPTITLEINQDTISWVAPESNGNPIILYSWESTDGKLGTTATTSVTLTQEGSTSQSYRVRAENVDGMGAWSPYSVEVTTLSPPFFPPFFPPYFPYFCPADGTILNMYCGATYTTAGGVTRQQTCYVTANGACGESTMCFSGSSPIGC